MRRNWQRQLKRCWPIPLCSRKWDGGASNASKMNSVSACSQNLSGKFCASYANPERHAIVRAVLRIRRASRESGVAGQRIDAARARCDGSYRGATWNPAIARFCRERLGDFDVVHIFGLYDLLGLAVARECRKQKIPYLIEPIGMFVPIVRNIFLKRVYHAQWGKEMLQGAAGLIATAEQEVEELAAGGIPRAKIALRRNGVMAPRQLPERGGFRGDHGIPAEALLILFLGRLSAKKSPDLLLESFA